MTALQDDLQHAAIKAVAPPDQNKWAEMRGHWRIVVAAILAYCVCTFPTYSFGVFLQPLADNFDVDKTAITGWSVFWSIGCILAAAPMGLLVDRFGARKVLLISLAIFAAVMLTVATQTTSLPLLYAGGFAIGAISAGLTGITLGRLLAGYFNRQLGAALGFMSSGVGISAILAPSIMQRTIDAHSWHWGFALSGVLAVAALPLIWFMTRVPARATGGPAASLAQGMTLRQALSTSSFWILAFGTLGFGICLGGMTVNLMPFLSELGLDRTAAAGLLGIYGISSITGRLLTGLLLDRLSFHVSHFMTVILASLTLLFLLLGVAVADHRRCRRGRTDGRRGNRLPGVLRHQTLRAKILWRDLWGVGDWNPEHRDRRRVFPPQRAGKRFRILPVRLRLLGRNRLGFSHHVRHLGAHALPGHRSRRGRVSARNLGRPVRLERVRKCWLDQSRAGHSSVHHGQCKKNPGLVHMKRPFHLMSREIFERHVRGGFSRRSNSCLLCED